MPVAIFTQIVSKTTVMQSRLPRLRFRFACVVAAALLAAMYAWTGRAQGGPQVSPCAIGPSDAAVANAASFSTMGFNVFGRAETGWAFYEPLIANEIGTACDAQSPGFAHALAAWQSKQHLPGKGIVDAATLDRLKQAWQGKRPFVIDSRHNCPAPPDEKTLGHATTAESYGGKEIMLRPEALAAYRKMVDTARKAGLVPPGGRMLQIFSAYRSPSYDGARCAVQMNCNGVVRAQCSPHRTALAMDVYLGNAPGFMPDSSADANRLFLSQSALYRWMVKNAGRFGFVNYAFEPWHWEYVEKHSPPR
jgi:D-alanyl-D-alanine carboxypeptidase